MTRGITCKVKVTWGGQGMVGTEGTAMRGVRLESEKDTSTLEMSLLKGFKATPFLVTTKATLKLK